MTGVSPLGAAPLSFVLLALLLAVSIQDALHRRIQNALVLLTFALAFVAWLGHDGWGSVGSPAAGALTAFALAIVPYAFGLLGAADVKIFAAYGAVAGFSDLPELLGYSAVLSGLLAVAYMAYWRRSYACALYAEWAAPRGALQRGRASGQTLPLAVSLSVGLLLTLKGGGRWTL